MKSLLVIILALIFAAWLGVTLHHHPGMMIITIPGWRIDLPLWLAVLGLILSYLLVHYTFRLLKGIWNIGPRFKRFTLDLRKKKSKRLTKKGFIALAEGKWIDAERHLQRGVAYNDMAWLNYLAAAKAAQELDNDQQRDQYLRYATVSMPEGDVAISLTQAELQYQHNQLEQSLITLTQLSNKAPNHPYVLKLMQKIYLRLSEWDGLLKLLPKLKQYHVFPDSQLKELEIKIYCGLLALELKNHSWQAMEVLWEKIPKNLRLEGDIAYFYVQALQQQGKPVEAETVSRSALKHAWREDLIKQYGQLLHPNPQKLLPIAESWLNQHPESPDLLLTLGRLCEQQQLWGKAQRYFEASLSLRPQAETYAELGLLLEKMNKPELGAQYFKKGLLLTTPSSALASRG